MFGTIKFFNTQRGFGFIRPDDGGADVFVHASACPTESVLREGQRVQFDIGADERNGRTKAVNLTAA
jgi:CspA family cold shock protein